MCFGVNRVETLAVTLNEASRHTRASFKVRHMKKISSTIVKEVEMRKMTNLWAARKIKTINVLMIKIFSRNEKEREMKISNNKLYGYN